jgi:hypothetical protein
MHPRTATEKDGKRYRWDKTGSDDVYLFVSLYLGDYDGKTKSEICQISPFHNYNKQGFFKTLISTQKCIDLFPCGFLEEGFQTKCLQGIDASKARGRSSTCRKNKSISMKKEQHHQHQQGDSKKVDKENNQAIESNITTIARH